MTAPDSDGGAAEAPDLLLDTSAPSALTTGTTAPPIGAGAIAGIVVGTMCCLICVLGAVAACWWQRRRDDKKSPELLNLREAKPTPDDGGLPSPHRLSAVPHGEPPVLPALPASSSHLASDRATASGKLVRLSTMRVDGEESVSYTHLTLPTNREV